MDLGGAIEGVIAAHLAYLHVMTWGIHLLAALLLTSGLWLCNRTGTVFVISAGFLAILNHAWIACTSIMWREVFLDSRFMQALYLFTAIISLIVLANRSSFDQVRSA